MSSTRSNIDKQNSQEDQYTTLSKDELKKLASGGLFSKGIPAAQYALALRYKGNKPEKLLKWMLTAATADHAIAQYTIDNERLTNGKDHYSWLLKAAHQGYLPAEIKLIDVYMCDLTLVDMNSKGKPNGYYNSYGTERNDRESMKWIERIVEKDQLTAINKLIQLCKKEYHFSRNDKEILPLFKKILGPHFGYRLNTDVLNSCTEFLTLIQSMSISPSIKGEARRCLNHISISSQSSNTNNDNNKKSSPHSNTSTKFTSPNRIGSSNLPGRAKQEEKTDVLSQLKAKNHKKVLSSGAMPGPQEMLQQPLQSYPTPPGGIPLPKPDTWTTDEKAEPHFETLSGAYRSFTSILSHSSGLIIGASCDDTSCFWDITSKKLVGYLPLSSDCLLELPNGRIMSGTSNGQVEFFDINYSSTPPPSANAENNNDDETIIPINIVIERPNNEDSIQRLIKLTDDLVICCDDNDDLQILDIKNKKCIKTIDDAMAGANSIIVVSDNTVLIGTTKLINLWDLSKGKIIKSFRGHSDIISSMSLLSNEGFISCSTDSIKLWNIKTGTCLKTLEHKDKLDYSKAEILYIPDNQILCGTNDGTLTLRCILTNRSIKSIKIHDGIIDNLQLLPHGRVLCGARLDIKIVDIGLRRSNEFNLEVITPGQLLENPKQLPIPSAPDLAEIESIYPNIPQVHWQRSIEISHSELTFGQAIGQGSFGIVYEGTLKSEKIAIKKLLNQNPSESVIEEFKKEGQLMAHLNSPYIVGFRGLIMKPEYCLVMEYMPKGSLYKILHGKDELTWKHRYNIISSIANGLAVLHTENILHRDLKSLNVLLDQNYRGVLADFGLAKLKTETQSISTKNHGGTLAWMAPELFKRKATYTKECDIYSAGITFWEIASRKIPYEDARGNQALIESWVSKNERDDIPTTCPDKISTLIKWCWKQEPSKRPTTNQLLDFIGKIDVEKDLQVAEFKK